MINSPLPSIEKEYVCSFLMFWTMATFFHIFQWRIQEFLGGVNFQGVGVRQPINLQKFGWKLHKNERILTETGRASLAHPWIHHCFPQQSCLRLGLGKVSLGVVRTLLAFSIILPNASRLSFFYFCFFCCYFYIKCTMTMYLFTYQIYNTHSIFL